MAGFGAALDLPKTGLDLAAMAAPAGQPGTGQPQSPTPADQGQGSDPAFGSKATPEEQDQYNRFIGRALELVYSDNAFPKIRDMLDGRAAAPASDGSDGGAGAPNGPPDPNAAPGAPDQVDPNAGGGDPVEGLAQATAMVVGRVAGAAEKSGIQLSPAVVLHAGTQVFEDLANLSKMTGAKDYTQDQNAFHKAYYRAIDIYRTMLQGAGEVNQDSAKADFSKMQAMDQRGQIEPMFMQLAKNDNQQQGGQQAAPDAAAGQAPPPRGFGG